MQEPFELGVVGVPDRRARRVVAEVVDELGRLRHGAEREADGHGDDGSGSRQLGDDGSAGGTVIHRSRVIPSDRSE